MKVLITGATGFIGSKVAQRLWSDGFEVVVVTRSIVKARKRLPFPLIFVEGDLSKGPLSDEALKNVDAVVNLAGENIGEGKWGEEEKKRILKSRADLSRNLMSSLNRERLKVFLQASAIGYYKDSDGDEWLDEESATGSGFLAEVCRQWEASAKELVSQTRVVVARIGVVLGPDGGLLKEMIPLFRAGLGGKAGSGEQWMSWIHVDDVVRFLAQALSNENFQGTYNLTAPEPVKNKNFTKLLGIYCQRPAFMAAPEFLLKTFMGDKSYLALSSQRIRSRLEKSDFVFSFGQIKSALKDACGYSSLVEDEEPAFHYVLRRAYFIESEPEAVFNFFAMPANLEKVAGKSSGLRLIRTSDKRLKKGSVFDFEVKKFGAGLKIVSRVEQFKEGERFMDYQMNGPFKSWGHEHCFEKVGNGTFVKDEVKYSFPAGILGDLAAALKGKREVEQMFDSRVEGILHFFKDAQTTSGRNQG